MASGSPLQPEICLGYLSALQAFALGVRTNQPITPTRRNVFPSGELRLGHIDRLCANPCHTDAHQLNREYPSQGLTLPVHFVTSDSTFRRKTPYRHPHSCAMTLRGSALKRWDDAILLADPALAFIQEASTRSFADTLLLGFEICGTYQQSVTAGPTRYHTEPLTSVRKIRNFLKRNPSLHGAARAQQALRYIADGSASPRETKAALLLGLPAYYGGYGLGIPRMNFEIMCTPEASTIAGRRTLRCDLFWPRARMALEYQSREFHTGELSRIRDSRRINALQSMGLKMIALTNNELDSLEATDVIANTIRKTLGHRFRTTVKDYHRRKLTLRRQLGLPLRPRETFGPGE